MNSSTPIAASFAILALVSLVSCSDPRERSDHVQLILSSDTLSPSTTFELRFDQPIVDANSAGRVVEPSPLVIEPGLKGRFAWLSPRSGVFTPETPTALGTAYRFTLRRGLKDAAGRPVDAQLDRRLRTPEFAVEHAWLGFSTSNVPATPEIKLNFNADVDPAMAQSYLEFRNRAGERIPARAVHATVGDGFYLNQWYPGEVMVPWQSRFRPSDPANPSGAPPDERDPGTNLVHHRLIVSPQRPLPVGAGWKLRVGADLPSAERRVRLASAQEFQLGDVVGFSVRGMTAHNARENGKAISIHFSKNLAETINASNLLDWLSVRPTPTNLSVRRYPQSVELSGAFATAQAYRVTVRAGLPAEDGILLAREWSDSTAFTPLPSRLYFPEFTTEQLAGGRREFELVAVNVPAVRVRAKRLDRDTLIHALRGYRSYFARGEDRDWQEPYREIDYNVVAGRPLFSRILPTTSSNIDESVRVPLQWDDVLGHGRQGAVFLVAEQPPPDGERRARQGTQAIVQVTDLGLAWKCSDTAATVHVFSHGSGRPVGKARVRLLTDDNEKLAECETDVQGLGTLPLATNAVWLLAESGDDLHAVRLHEHEIYLYNYGVRYDWNREERDNREVFLFTDRPLYRPGETVHFKGLVRDRDEETFRIPAGAKAILRVMDPKEEKVFETNLVVTAGGSVAVSFVLPDGVRGTYNLALHLGERSHHHGVRVADFQPNAFAVTLDAKQNYAAGEMPRVPLGAKYLMGAPVTRAKVAWSLEAIDEGFYPPGFDDYLFTTEWIDPEWNRGRSSFTAHGESLYFSKSNFVIAPELALNPAAPQPRSVHLRAEVTDLNQQTITRSTDFIVHSSEFYLGIGRFKNILRAGEPLNVELIAVRADGRAHVPPVETKVTLFRVDQVTIPIQGASRARRYRTESLLTNVASVRVTTQPARKAGDPVVPGQGAMPSVVPDRAGQWLLEARAVDSSGHDVVSVSAFSVAGRSENAWAYRNETQMDLVPDKADYFAGETASILVKAPFAGHALVTVERDKVMRSFVTELNADVPSIEVPLRDLDAPNVFVSVLLLRGSEDSSRKFKMPEHRLGYCELKVTNPWNQLQVSIRSDAADYRPSQRVNLTAEITDSTGRAARDTEVTLYAVDEGILNIGGDATPDPYGFFFRPRPIGVRCALSLPSLFPEDPEHHRFGNKGYLIGGGGRDRVRKNFLPCAYWNAGLVTDEAGRVTASFDAPDSLTRYRVIAVAHNARHQFGNGAAHFEVNKPLMIEPALPRFAHVTDHLVARAVVHNQTVESGQVEVSLHLDDKAAPTGGRGEGKELTRTVTVAANASAPVEFPVEFMDAGNSRWIWRAHFREGTDAVRPISNISAGRRFVDAVESTLLVEFLSPMFREIHLAHTDAAGMNLLAAANPQLLEGRGTVSVSVANSRLCELGEALRYLLHYPYGCVEQTGSSLLPWIVLRDAPSFTPGLSKSPEEFNAAIRAGVQRLLAMQTDSGGLSYWPGGRQPMFWGSAYGGLMLALARREGHAVAPLKFDLLLKYLAAELHQSGVAERDGIDLSAACLALYTLALANKAEPAYHELLFKQRDRLSTDNRALLALAISECNGPATMAVELLAARAAPTRSSMDWFGCGPRDVALQLLALSRQNPNDPRIDVLVAELTHSRQEGCWSTTQGNAWAVFALKEYADRIERGSMPVNGSLSWASQSRDFVLPARLASYTAIFPITRESAQLPLTLTNPDQRRLYTQVTLEARPSVAHQPRQNRGFNLVRRYFQVDDDGMLSDVGTLRVGDRVLVSLILDVEQPAHYLVIDDALPAVLEPLNPAFKSQETPRIAAPGSLPSYPWYDDHREFRSDRALFFRDHVETPGRYEIRYLTRVRAAGTVTSPCAKAQEMYHPERFGLTETATLTALPLE